VRLSLLFCALALAGCERRELSDDLVATVAAYGVDYAGLKKDAYRDVQGLRGFMLFAGTTDGAASEGYASELGKLLEHWGDARFSAALDGVTSSVREPVLSMLAYEGGLHENLTVWSAFAARFPGIATRLTARTVR
jgi:hypothetical protein